MLGLVLLQPVVFGFNLLSAVGTPSRYPVIGNGIENKTGALLSNRETLFLSEFLPFGLGLLLGGWLLSRGHELGLWQVNTPESLSVLEDLTIIAPGFSLLLSFQVEQVFE